MLIIPSLAVVLALSACGSSSSGTSASSNHQIAWSIELWPGNFTSTSSGHCTDNSSAGNYENGAPISLVGPDGTEISSATLSFGILQKTTQDLTQVSNPPSGKICYFSVTFPNVPVVATYRVKTRDGVISPVSHVLADVKSANWTMGELIGANFKQ